MAAFDLARQRDLLRAEVLPRYAALAPLSFAYMQWSLVRGFTDRADLDIIAVWHAPEVPADRAALVDGLEERRPPASTVVDYRDVHLDRFVLGGQEYNVGHHALPDFRELVAAAMEGRELPGERIIAPLTLASGFSTAELLVDATGAGSVLQASVAAFPAHLRQRALHALRQRGADALAELRTHVARQDWFAFQGVLLAATRAAVQALLARRATYYPGDKWLRPALLRAGVAAAVAAFDAVLAPAAAPTQRIAALEALIQHALSAEPEG